MRKLSLVVAVALALCGSALGQETPRVEVFGGYSYLNVDTNGLSSRQSANGWEAAVSGNFNRWFAVEGDFSGYYKTYTFNVLFPGLPTTVNVDVRDYGFMGGPRFNYGPVFVHALIGGDHLSGSALGVSASQDSLAGAFGGGVQWPMSGHWAVRASSDYVFTRHNLLGGPSVTQNNFRASVGVVYLFGSAREPAPRNERRTVKSQPCEGSSEAALLGVVGCSSDSGLLVTSVRPGSPAVQAGIAPGDIVASIDGRPVRDSHEIETAIAANTTGTIRIGYMVKGNWLTEREVKVR